MSKDKQAQKNDTRVVLESADDLAPEIAKDELLAMLHDFLATPLGDIPVERLRAAVVYAARAYAEVSKEVAKEAVGEAVQAIVDDILSKPKRRRKAMHNRAQRAQLFPMKSEG